jgi:hypothetical protein
MGHGKLWRDKRHGRRRRLNMRWYLAGSGGGRQDHRILKLYFLHFLFIRIEEEVIKQR